MLTVSSFNLTPKVAVKKNMYANNSIQSKFQLQSDYVSFSANPVRPLDKFVEETSTHMCTKYSNILGPEFVKKFLNPLNEFLEKEGITIKLGTIKRHIYVKEYFSENKVVAKNAFTAAFVDKNGNPLHLGVVGFDTLGRKHVDKVIKGMTANEAKVKLVKFLCDDFLEVPEKSVLKNTQIPEELKNAAREAYIPLFIFKSHLYDKLGAMDAIAPSTSAVRKVLEKFMPEN